MARAVSMIATIDTIRVIVGQRVSFEKNITGDQNGMNPEKSTQPAIVATRSARRRVVMVSPCVVLCGDDR